MKSKSEDVRVEVVTRGEYDKRKFDGLVVNGAYWTKGEARGSGDPVVSVAYRQVRQAFKTNSYSLSDAPLRSYANGHLKVWHHDLKKEKNYR